MSSFDQNYLKTTLKKYFDSCYYNCKNSDEILQYINKNHLELTNICSIRPKFFTEKYKYSVVPCDMNTFNSIDIPSELGSVALIDCFVRSNIIDLSQHKSKFNIPINAIYINNHFVIVDEESYAEDHDINYKINIIFNRLKKRYKYVELLSSTKYRISLKCDDFDIFIPNVDIYSEYIFRKNSPFFRCESTSMMYAKNGGFEIINFKYNKCIFFEKKTAAMKYYVDYLTEEKFSSEEIYSCIGKLSNYAF